MSSNRSSSCPEPDLVERVQRFNYIRDFWRSKECLAPFPYMDVFQSASESDDCSSVESPHLPHPPPFRPCVAWQQVGREESGGCSSSGAFARQNRTQHNSPTAQWLRKHNTEGKLCDHPHCTCTTDICTSMENRHRKMQPVPRCRPQPRQVATSVAAVYQRNSEVTTLMESASCGFHSYETEGGSVCLHGGGDSGIKEDSSSINTGLQTLTPLPSISPTSQAHQCQRRIFLILAVLCVVFVSISALCSHLWNPLLLDPHPPDRGQSGAPSPFYPSSSLWMNMPDPDRPPQKSAGCDWDCLKLLFN